MDLNLLLLAALVLLLLLVLYWLIRNEARSRAIQQTMLQAGQNDQAFRDLELKIKEELMHGRTEMGQSARDLRLELLQQVTAFSKTITEHIGSASEMQYRQLHQFSEQLYKLTQSSAERFALFQDNIDNHNAESRIALQQKLDLFKTELQAALKDYREKLRENFSDFERNQALSHTHTGEKLTDIKKSLELSLKSLQDANERKLEDMRRTVDEKLNETLEKRLGESFKQVSERLEAVHKGLGDMQHLALSVGDLKKVMSNVKSRGVLGEYQLQNLLEDLLTNEQYARNVKTKAGSGAMVEFAIKMPHGGNQDKMLWLPVDAKFPREDYELLVQAYEEGQQEHIEQCRRAFAGSIRKNAQDIKEKYIDPPNTTEYGIMFLPFESLYAEVLRVPGLFEKLQRDYKVTITGPTTLSALLNSLQMGFRTLAIEKRSTEVWDLLAAVKTEFGQFGALLDKTKKKLEEASHVIDGAGVRTRAIHRKLSKVSVWPAVENLPMPQEDNDINQEIKT